MVRVTTQASRLRHKLEKSRHPVNAEVLSASDDALNWFESDPFILRHCNAKPPREAKESASLECLWKYGLQLWHEYLC
jgi:hypothetical protein